MPEPITLLQFLAVFSKYQQIEVHIAGTDEIISCDTQEFPFEEFNELYVDYVYIIGNGKLTIHVYA